MIIYKSGDAFTIETRLGKPAEDFSGGRALYVIDESDEGNAELIADIKRLAPFFTVECGADGKVVSVTDDTAARAAYLASRKPPLSAEERIAELEAALEMLLSEVVE